MEYKMEELVPIVARLVRKYTGCDSTSITYEKAQMLMEGVIYCLNEYSCSSQSSLLIRNMPVDEKYNIGANLVHEKASSVRMIFNEMSAYFDDYEVEVLYDTVQKGIPEFF